MKRGLFAAKVKVKDLLFVEAARRSLNRKRGSDVGVWLLSKYCGNSSEKERSTKHEGDYRTSSSQHQSTSSVFWDEALPIDI